MCGIVDRDLPLEFPYALIRGHDGQWYQLMARVYLKNVTKLHGEHVSTYDKSFRYPREELVRDHKFNPETHDDKIHYVNEADIHNFDYAGSHTLYLLATKQHIQHPHGQQICLGGGSCVPLFCSCDGGPEIIDGEYREIPEVKYLEKRGINFLQLQPPSSPIYESEIARSLLLEPVPVRTQKEPEWVETLRTEFTANDQLRRAQADPSLAAAFNRSRR